MSRAVRRMWNIVAGTVCGAGLVLVLAGSISPPSAHAVDFFEDICNQQGSSDSTACNTSGQNELTGGNGVINRVTGMVALFAGIAAVIIIIIGGFMYITSNGESSKISAAKSTIIYAVVGLVVIGLARTIVYFVISRL